MTAARRAPRLQLTVSPSERDALAQIAQRSREPEATTAARLLRAALLDHGSALEERLRRPTTPPEPVDPPPEESDSPWLPPQRHLLAIERLRARYPHELKHLPADLLSDNLIAEQLAALAHWREQLDDGYHLDPRMELAFGHEVRSIATWLQQRARSAR